MSIAEPATVNAREVNVVVEGVDSAGIGCSFSVHLLRDGNRIASRFHFQPSVAESPVDTSFSENPARFDFVLPVEDVAGGELKVEIEPVDPQVTLRSGVKERATISVYLMLES